MQNKNVLKLFLLVVAFSSMGCLRSTAGTEVGIKISKFFGEDQIVQPGKTAIVIPILHDWYVYDKKLQVLEMKEFTRAGKSIDDDLDFKTVDGNDIGVDVTIQWRVSSKDAPKLLRFVAPDMFSLQNNVVRPLARSIPRDALNELTSEEFYDSKKRAAKEQLAHERLNEALKEFGLICDRVILKDYRFHDEYQKAIDDKKVADQEVNKFKSAADAAVRKWERMLEEEKGQVAQLIASEEGKAKQVELQANAYFESKKLDASAITTERKAQAKGLRKQRQAIAGAGGKTMVKLRVAEALQGKRIILIPISEGGGINLQRTDINDLLGLMGMEKAAEKKTGQGGSS